MPDSRSLAKSLLVLTALLGGYGAVSLTLGPSRSLDIFAGVVLCLAPLAANLGFLANAGSPYRRQNVFWMFWAVGCGLWSLGELLWLIGASRGNQPVLLEAIDFVLFMSAVPMIAAVVVCPHRRRWSEALRYGYLDLALLTAWAAYLYAFFVLGPGGGLPEAPAYDRNYLLLTLAVNLALVSTLLFQWRKTTDPWRNLYAHLFGASTLHAAGWLLIRWAIVRGGYSPGSLYDLPLLASFAWFGYAGIDAHHTARETEPAAASAADHRWSLPLSVIGIVSLPALGCWAMLERSSAVVEQFRLNLTLGGILVGTLLLIARQRRVDAYRRVLLRDTQLSLDKTNRLQAQLVLTEKLASLGHLAADAAREISDPLAAIFGYTELVLAEPAAPESVRASARKIQVQAHRTSALVDNLLRFAQQVSAEKCLLDMNALLSSAVELQRFQLSDRRVTVRLDLEPNLPAIRGNAKLLLQVFYEIINNAADAMDAAGGELGIRTRLEGGDVTVEFPIALIASALGERESHLLLSRKARQAVDALAIMFRLIGLEALLAELAGPRVVLLPFAFVAEKRDAVPAGIRYVGDVNGHDRPHASEVREMHAQAGKFRIARLDCPAPASQAQDLRRAFERAEHQNDPAIFFQVGDGFDAAPGQIEISRHLRSQDSECIEAFRGKIQHPVYIERRRGDEEHFLSLDKFPDCSFNRRMLFPHAPLLDRNPIPSEHRRLGISNRPLDRGKALPHLDSAKMRSFGADRRCDGRSQIARGAEVAADGGIERAHLFDFLNRRRIDFLLRIEAGPHGPFVQQMQQRSRFHHANRRGVRQQVERQIGRDAAIDQLALRRPRFFHRLPIERESFRIAGNQARRDVIGRPARDQPQKRPRARNHAMPLVLAIGRMTDSLGEREMGVLESAHHRRMNAHVERFQPVGVSRGIEQTIDRLGVGTGAGWRTDRGAVSGCDRFNRLRRIVDQFGNAAGEPLVEFTRIRFSVRRRNHRRIPFGKIFERFAIETIEELWIDFAHAINHRANHFQSFRRRIGSQSRPPKPVQHDARKRVDHRRESSYRQNVTGHFDGPFLGLALHFLHPLGMRHLADMPYLAKDLASVGFQQIGERAVMFPGAGDGAFVNLALGRAESLAGPRDVGLRAVQSDVSLALLFGIVERMRVEKRPNELAAHIFEAKFEMSMLVNGVMASVKRSRADGESLLVGDLLRLNDSRRITSASGGNRRIVGMLEPIPQADARPRRFDQGSSGVGGLVRHLLAILHTMPLPSTGLDRPAILELAQCILLSSPCICPRHRVPFLANERSPTKQALRRPTGSI
jgi:signal transduction histidine kinase